MFASFTTFVHFAIPAFSEQRELAGRTPRAVVGDNTGGHQADSN